MLVLGLGPAVLLLGSTVAMAIGPFHRGYCPPCEQPADAMVTDDGDLPPAPDDGEMSDVQPSDALAGAGTQDLAAAAFGHVPTYIDNAMPMNLIRIRYDNLQGANRPDRAEYFYPTYSALGGPIPGVSFADEVDFEVISLYAERMISCQTSVFVEVPFRFVDFSVLQADNSIDNRNTSGIGDVNFGFKRVLCENCCGDYLTAQLRVYTPTGDGADALGVDHVSIEPAILWYKNVSCRSFLFGEVRDWISIDGTEVVKGRFSLRHYNLSEKNAEFAKLDARIIQNAHEQFKILCDVPMGEALQQA